MGNAVKLGDTGSDHEGFPPTAVIGASSSVKADGIGLARQGDPLMLHAKPNHPPHPRKIAAGSGSVFADGKPVARSGDAIDCGGTVTGGGTVNIG
ncbi:type VI secretion system PAAR protein [Shewanella sp. VB17]|uniref:type VI secretion system PAAR protein n=1 Tax=Shewanella sp. VB17 TaxID=2739432 RepID=UPI001566F993|nr:type VI secretion system PAAR protein [Shewanella sp. VB17]NRD71934.1 type VI secretion system PAAR protein [Shewanella sp. VB17]